MYSVFHMRTYNATAMQCNTNLIFHITSYCMLHWTFYSLHCTTSHDDTLHYTHMYIDMHLSPSLYVYIYIYIYIHILLLILDPKLFKTPFGLRETVAPEPGRPTMSFGGILMDLGGF